jgi:hypothetical protein
MPTWKKVIVSGSAAELSQLNVGANQQITTAQGTTFLTGSFTGSFVGSGAGLTGVTATAIFPTTAKTDLATTDQFFINDGASKFVTYGNLVTDLAGSGAGTSNLTTTDTGDSLALTSQIAVTGVTASFLGNVAGTASWASNVVGGIGVTSVATAGTVSGITLTGGTITSTGTITLGGSISGLTNSNLSGTAGITNANLANSAITIAGTSTSLGGSITAATILSGTGVFSGSAQIPNSSIQNAQLANSSVTVGSTAISLGSSATTLAGLVSVTSTGFTGSLLGTASWANNATTAATANATTAALTAGAGLLSGGTFNGSTARTFSVDSGSMLPYYSGSIFSTLSGGATVAQNGVVTLKTGLVSGSSIASGAQGEVTLTTNGVAASAVDLGLQTTDSPQFVGLTLTGDAAVNGGDITTSATTFNLVNSNATTVNFAGAATTLNLGNASGTTTVAGNAVVQGDFTVNGTTTYLNVQDLYVEDKFIVLASGSATAGDGGIIIDRGSDAAGNIAYGFDSVTDRWGFQSGLADSTNTFDPTANSGVSGSFVPYLFTETSHGSTKPITGEFAVVGSQYMDAAGNFWIYTA